MQAQERDGVGEMLSDQTVTRSYQLNNGDDLDPLIERIGDAQYVLLGEASHGTHEYYLWRSRLSRRLIEEKSFRFIAVEGDWPDCYRVNQFVRGYDSSQTAEDVLRAFARWPTWMWANWEVVALAEWLRLHNRSLPTEKQTGFYGLDVYALWESLASIIDYLRRHHPDALASAEDAFRCFEPYGGDPQSYALATRFVPTDCEDEVTHLLTTVRQRAGVETDGRADEFNAVMNAESVKGAETYYRAMIAGGAESWNGRDRHMASTLNRLMQFHGSDAKAIVWEHNTHIGDARFTDMASAGMINLGQLVRETNAAENVVLVGFGSYQGRVIAGRSWDAPMEIMTVPPAQSGSWEHAFHQLDQDDRLLLFQPSSRHVDALTVPRGHRAIGVVYRPEAETGNYVPTILPLRYDVFLFLDQTSPLHPLHIASQTGPPELYPWGV